MKLRRIHNGIADPAETPPGHHHTSGDLAAILRAYGVSEHVIPEAEAAVYLVAMEMAAHVLRRVALALPNTPEGRALQIALIGRRGMTFEQHAAEVGATKGNLCRGAQRMEARISGIETAG